MRKYIIILVVFILLLGTIVIVGELQGAGVFQDKTPNPVQVASEYVNSESTAIATVQPASEVNVTAYDVEEDVQEVVESDSQEMVSNEVELQIDAKLTAEDWEQRKTAKLDATHIGETMKASEDLYVYNTMDARYKQLYAEIYLLITGHANEVAICTIDENALAYAYDCVLADHPEIFYTDGYIFSRHTSNQVLQKITFSAKYTMSYEAIAQMQNSLDLAEQRYKIGLPASTGDYEKVKYTYEYIIQNTEYDVNAAENQNIISVMLNGRSVCQGYAKTMQYLLQKNGVECLFVVGSDAKGEGHSWNMVNVDGAYYYVDVTWGDASYIQDPTSQTMGGISYDYLCITTDELCQTHIIDNVVPLPQCISTDANYFVKEDLMLDSIDDARLRDVFGRAYQSGQGYVTVKCANSEVYSLVSSELLDGQRIFDYLPNETEALSYTSNTKQYTYTFLF